VLLGTLSSLRLISNEINDPQSYAQAASDARCDRLALQSTDVGYCVKNKGGVEFERRATELT